MATHSLRSRQQASIAGRARASHSTVKRVPPGWKGPGEQVYNEYVLETAISGFQFA